MYPRVYKEIWQRVNFVSDRKSVEKRGYSFVCPIPICGQTIELDSNEIKPQIGECANCVPEETEEA